MTLDLSLFAKTAFARHPNAQRVAAAEYPSPLHAVIDPRQAATAIADIRRWPGYHPTPMHSLDDMAQRLGLAAVYYKDESSRFGLGSFKALGGAYAVACLLKTKAAEKTGAAVSTDDLRAGQYAAVCGDITAASATDGNHGRSVAWGAKQFGCRCVIYIHSQVSRGRQLAIESFGATVVRVDGDYDDSVRALAAAAAKNGWTVVSDTSYPGYTDIPKTVMAGYSVMIDEALSQLPQTPSHVFVQGGVGGLAAAVCAYLWRRLKDRRPRFVVVEPRLADCLYQSAVRGSPVTKKIAQESVMAGLSCGEVSTVAWEVLAPGVDDFLTIDDELIAPLMREFHHRRPPIIAGETATAGLAGCIAAAVRPATARLLALNAQSTVLVFGTEGATDAEIYAQLTGEPPPA